MGELASAASSGGVWRFCEAFLPAVQTHKRRGATAAAARATRGTRSSDSLAARRVRTRGPGRGVPGAGSRRGRASSESSRTSNLKTARTQSGYRDSPRQGHGATAPPPRLPPPPASAARAPPPPAHRPRPRPLLAAARRRGKRPAAARTPPSHAHRPRCLRPPPAPPSRCRPRSAGDLPHPVPARPHPVTPHAPTLLTGPSPDGAFPRQRCQRPSSAHQSLFKSAAPRDESVHLPDGPTSGQL